MQAFQHTRRIHPLLTVKFHELTSADHYEGLVLYRRLKGFTTADTEEGNLILEKKMQFVLCILSTDELIGEGETAGIGLPKVTGRSSDQELVESFKWFMELPTKATKDWYDAVDPPPDVSDDPKA